MPSDFSPAYLTSYKFRVPFFKFPNQPTFRPKIKNGNRSLDIISYKQKHDIFGIYNITWVYQHFEYLFAFRRIFNAIVLFFADFWLAY